MGIKALGEDDSTFLIPNSAPSFIPWEISDTDKTLELTVALRETTAGSGVLAISRRATFNFIYE